MRDPRVEMAAGLCYVVVVLLYYYFFSLSPVSHQESSLVGIFFLKAHNKSSQFISQ